MVLNGEYTIGPPLGIYAGPPSHNGVYHIQSVPEHVQGYIVVVMPAKGSRVCALVENNGRNNPPTISIVRKIVLGRIFFISLF